MTGINFGTVSTVSATPSARRLKPWEIHDVKFAGCKIESFQGKKDPSKNWEMLKVRWENENGYFEENMFFITKPEDLERRTYKTKEGHEKEFPSTHERNQVFAKQLVHDVNPAMDEKFSELSKKVSTYKDFATLIIKLTDSMKGKHQTRLKLNGKTDKDGNVVPVLPNFVAIGNDGKPWCSDAFVGPNAEFSAYELGKRKEYLEAKPTDMSKVVKEEATDIAEPTTDNTDIEEVDTTDLINGLDL